MKRFWDKVNKTVTNECWEWQASFRSGYGAFKVDGKVVSAHRFSYELLHGSIPDDLLICHSCNNKKCVNPAHLYAGTHKDNYEDMVSAGNNFTVPIKEVCTQCGSQRESRGRRTICRKCQRGYNRNYMRKVRSEGK